MPEASHGVSPFSTDLSHAPQTKSHASPIQVFQYAHLSLLGPPASVLPALRNPTVPPSLPMSLQTPQSIPRQSQPVGFSLSVPLGSTPHLTATWILWVFATSALGALFPSEERILPHCL